MGDLDETGYLLESLVQQDIIRRGGAEYADKLLGLRSDRQKELVRSQDINGLIVVNCANELYDTFAEHLRGTDCGDDEFYGLTTDIFNYLRKRRYPEAGSLAGTIFRYMGMEQKHTGITASGTLRELLKVVYENASHGLVPIIEREIDSAGLVGN